LAYARASGATSVTAQLQTPAAAPADEATAAPEPVSSWSSPFEWRPTSDRSSRVSEPGPKVSAAKRTGATRPAPVEPVVDPIALAAPVADEKPAPGLEAFRREDSVLETSHPDTVEPSSRPDAAAKAEALHVVEPIHAA